MRAMTFEYKYEKRCSELLKIDYALKISGTFQVNAIKRNSLKYIFLIPDNDYFVSKTNKKNVITIDTLKRRLNVKKVRKESIFFLPIFLYFHYLSQIISS